MAENVRPPVAIRIVRPYESEDELLEHELDTIGKTSVVLIGAHPRPTGVILRFEVTLSSGATVLRGEGRVLAHKDNAFRGQSGLTLRFTRLDPRSKAVVDRATAMREARQAEGGTPSRPAPRIESPIAEALTASTPLPSAVDANAQQEAAVASVRATAREKANATARANARRTGASVPPSGKTMALTPPPLPVSEEPLPVSEEPMPEPEPEPEPVTSVPGEVQYGGAPMAPATPDSTSDASAVDAADSPMPRRSKRVAAKSSRAAAPAPAEVFPVAPAEIASVASEPAEPREPAQPHEPHEVHAAISSPADPADLRPAVSGPLEPPPDRADLLSRLRERAGRLAPEQVEAILASRP